MTYYHFVSQLLSVTVEGGIFVLASTSYNERMQRLLRYSVAQDYWDEFDLPENTLTAGIAAFGHNIVLYTGTGGDETAASSDWLLDTTTGQWQRMPDDPLGPGFGRRYVAFGEDLYLFDHALVPSPNGADGPSYLRAARLRDTQWEVLPMADSIGQAPTLVAGNLLIAPTLGCADGGGTNGFGRCIPYGAVFDTDSDTWSELPNAPGRGTRHVDSSGGLGDNGLVLSDPGHPALDALTGEWFVVPQLDSGPGLYTQRDFHAAGPYGFTFGGAAFSFEGSELLNDAWIWVP